MWFFEPYFGQNFAGLRDPKHVASSRYDLEGSTAGRLLLFGSRVYSFLSVSCRTQLAAAQKHREVKCEPTFENTLESKQIISRAKLSMKRIRRRNNSARLAPPRPRPQLLFAIRIDEHCGLGYSNPQQVSNIKSGTSLMYLLLIFIGDSVEKVSCTRPTRTPHDSMLIFSQTGVLVAAKIGRAPRSSSSLHPEA